MFACLHGPGDLTALAFEFSPLVERTAEDTVTFDVSGLERLFGLAQEIAYAITRRAAELRVKANLALAMNADAAICAARGFAGTSIIPQGDEAKFLGSLPLAALPLAGRHAASQPQPANGGPAGDPGIGGPAPFREPATRSLCVETLERWGIRRFQDLAALPPLGIAERLGPEGLRLRELARGEAERKLAPLEDPLRFEEEIELEYPVELLEPLAFLLARLIHGLATRLAARGLATDELRVRLRLEDRSTHERALRLPVPSLDTKAFLKLLELDLGAHPPAAPVVLVRMEMKPVKPRAAQAGLYVLAAPEPVKLELTLARIRGIVGQERVGYVELLDTHRPEGYRMAKRAAGTAPSKVMRTGGSQACGMPVGRLKGRPTGADGLSSPLAGSRGPWNTPSKVSRTAYQARRNAGKDAGMASREACATGNGRAGGAAVAFRIFRPARAARVELAAGQPGFVAAAGIRGRVVEYAGPWRSSGDWWTAAAWQRDEWDIALSDGALYRLFCSPKGWFVEGSYD